MAQMQAMTQTECWEHLRSHRVGRIGFDRGRGPRIHPVAYTVKGDELYLTTSRGSELGMFAELFSEGCVVPFEVDDVDEAAVQPWSVLVDARMHRDGSAALVAASVPGACVPDGHDEVVLRLTPIQVTGRRQSRTPAGLSA